MSGALEGIRVIDFGQYLAGPLLAMMLADQGADVVRVDPPGGPMWRHHANAILQRGKRSIALDLKQAGDLAVARRLVETADVVVENFRPGVMDRLGLGHAAMLAGNPRLIFCSLPGFASDDPRAGLAAYEGVVSAAAGIYVGPRWAPQEDDPIYNPLPLASNYAALRAAQCVTAALIARQRGAPGQRIEVPLFDASFELIGAHMEPMPNQTTPRLRTPAPAGGTYECADSRRVQTSWVESRQLPWFAEHFGERSWFDDGLVAAAKSRSNPALVAELRQRLAAVFKTRTSTEWARIAAHEADLAECFTSAEWLQDEHARTSREIISLTDPEYGETTQAGYPVSMSATPPEASGPRRPLDADRAAILAELETFPAPATPTTDGHVATIGRALEGMRVIDATQVVAGPTAGRILAEFGADVIKVNNPDRRDWAMMVRHHQYLNSGKRTVLLDLKRPEGMEVFWRLIGGADVFLMNFLPPAARRLGVDYDAVRSRKPEIVYGAVSCFGSGGWRETFRGHEELGQAITGMQMRWGAGLDEPTRQTFLVCDYGTGNLAAFAILLGLFHRLRSGEGQLVGASLAQTGTFQQIPFTIDYPGRDWHEPLWHKVKGWGPLYRLYRAGDRWFFLAAPGSDARVRLAAVAGLAGIDRIAEGALEATLTERFAGATAAEWTARLTDAGFGAHVLRDVEENFNDDWVRSHQLVIERDFPQYGPHTTVGPSGRLSATPVRPNAVVAPPGSDNRAVLAELGLADRIDALLTKGVLSDGAAERPAVPSQH